VLGVWAFSLVKVSWHFGRPSPSSSFSGWFFGRWSPPFNYPFLNLAGKFGFPGSLAGAPSFHTLPWYLEVRQRFWRLFTSSQEFFFFDGRFLCFFTGFFLFSPPWSYLFSLRGLTMVHVLYFGWETRVFFFLPESPLFLPPSSGRRKPRSPRLFSLSFHSYKPSAHPDPHPHAFTSVSY